MTRTRTPLLLGLRLVRIFARLVPALAAAIVVVACAYVLGASDPLKRQAWVVAAFILGFRLVTSLFTEVLSPHRPRMRLWRMPDHRAKRMAAMVQGLTWVLLGTEVAIYLVRANDWSESVAALLGLIRTCGLIAFGALALWRSAIFARFRPQSTETYGQLARAILARVALPLIVAGAFFFVVAHALGYVALAEWTARNVLTSIVILLAVALVYRWLRTRVHAAVQFMRDEKREGGVEPSPAFVGVEHISLGALRILGVLVTALALFSTWNVDTAWFAAHADRPILGAFGPRLGPFTQGIGAAFLVVVIGAFLRNVLIFFVFPNANVDVGVRYAVLTILRYAVFVLGAIFVLGAFGLDTSALAVFAGAFGVGLAFGLQDIFANFFAGMIMLLERPVRVGDSVEVGATSGHVEAIRLRGTLIRTFDKTTVMIPNRQMIGERVTNLSQDRDIARITILVGVGYESDPTHVKEVLAKVADNDGRIDEALVRLTGFGESSINFTMLCYTKLVGERGAIGSDLHAAVLMALRREEIEIPFPQRDLRIIYDVRQEQAANP